MAANDVGTILIHDRKVVAIAASVRIPTYDHALACGTDLDKPRRLAKWVKVEHGSRGHLTRGMGELSLRNPGGGRNEARMIGIGMIVAPGSHRLVDWLDIQMQRHNLRMSCQSHL